MAPVTMILMGATMIRMGIGTIRYVVVLSN
jgi:hypothetical protein